MKNILSIIAFTIIVLIFSSYKTGAPDSESAPVPPYTMVDITDPPSCYAIKVRCPNYSSGDECTVYNPNYSSIWNMAGGYSTYVTVYVFIKLYSDSDWSLVGFVTTDHETVTTTWVGSFASCINFSYDSILEP